MAAKLYATQFFSTELNVGGGINNSQTTGIIASDVTGVDTTKPGAVCVSWANPLNTTTAEIITYTSISGSELQGVTRGAGGTSAKAHSNGATMMFSIIARDHINQLVDMFEATGLEIKQISTPANPPSGRNKLYFKSDDKLYKLTSAGTESEVGAGGGGGAGASGIMLDWANASLPDTNFPSISKTVGTNWTYKTLGFDQSTDEACYWNVMIPSDLASITSAKLHLHWTASGGTPGQACYWQVTTRSVANDEVIDATTTPSTATDTGNDVLLATGDAHLVTITLTTTGWAASDLLQIKLNRDADNGSDNLAADALVLQCFLEIR